MDKIKFDISSKGCVADDTVLTAHVQSCLARNLPVCGQHAPHDIVAILVGSGPTLAGQLDSIKRQRQRGRPVFAMNEAHDWLVGQGFVPDYAVAIDPQDHVQKWFAKKQPTVAQHPVKYFIASQCHPATFDYLSDCQVWTWHINFNNGAAFPPDTTLINGGTTTGLRAITLLYTMGFRRFELYGYDSCLQHGVLRINGDTPDREGIIPIVVNDRLFVCTPEMAVQACGLQKIMGTMPDIGIQSHGDGLITAILDARDKAAQQASRQDAPQEVPA